MIANFLPKNLDLTFPFHRFPQYLTLNPAKTKYCSIARITKALQNDKGTHIQRTVKVIGLAVLLSAIAGAYWLFVLFPRQAEARLNRVVSAGPMKASARAKALHAELFIADLHADSLLFGRDLVDRSAIGHVDVPRLQEGNVALQAFTVVTKVPKALNIERNTADSDEILKVALVRMWPAKTWMSLTERALYQASLLRRFSEGSRGQLRVIRSRSDLDAFVAERSAGKRVIAGWLGIEGAHALDGKVENIDRLYDAGFRMIGLTHFFDNEFAGSAHGAEKGGLTPLGRELVRRMETRRVIVDLAHASPRTIDHVLAMATRPMLVSHTGVQGTCNNARNLSDRNVRAIAAKGGVIGIGYWKTAVCGSTPAAIARAIRYAVNVAGIDHVALGSDFDGAVTTPFDASGVLAVTDALVDAGFSNDEIRKIMGGNVLRFLQENLPAL
jgi:membrane dipeptidase